MQANASDLILFTLLFVALLAMLLGVLWTWIWALRRLWRGTPLLAGMLVLPVRRTLWGGPTILLTIFAYLLVSGLVFRGYERVTGRHIARQQGAGEQPKAGPPLAKARGAVRREMDRVVEVTTAPDRLPDPGRADAPGKGPEDEAVQTQGELMFQSALINGVLLLVVPTLILPLAGARMADLGLDPRDWPTQVFYGVRAGFLITPVVFAVQTFAVQVWKSQKHPLEQMIMERFTPGAAFLAALSALVLAPVVEETLFRGLFQRWIGRRFENTPGEALAEAVSASGPAHEPSVQGLDDSWTNSHDDDPLNWKAGSDEGVTVSPLPIILTSALFAGMHYLQWPAPIAIFILSLWLGTVYQQSRSLITAIALHATFNGFSTLFLLLEAIGRKLEPVQPQAAAWLLPGISF